MRDQSGTAPVLIGESNVGDGAEAAHINTVLGGRHGPVGTAVDAMADMQAARRAPASPVFSLG